MSRVKAIHQLIGKSSLGNSVANFALALQDALRLWGYKSNIYANEVDPALAHRVRPLQRFQPRPDGLTILHYVRANEVTERVQRDDFPLILCYHNITPASYFVGVGNAQAQASLRGGQELAGFQSRTRLALTFSNHSEADLRAAGYTNIQVLPLLLPRSLQQIGPDERVLAQASPGPNLLFVGRIVPNKRCEDVVRILHQYRQITPEARLFLVGARRYALPYVTWLRDEARRLSVSDAIIFSGHVSEAELAAYYRIADFFVMMSEHEGFGIPLIESMRMDVPVVAFASSAVPDTLGGAGVLIRQKRFDIIAELLHLVHTSVDLRTVILDGQRDRIRVFEPDRVLAEYRTQIKAVAD